MLHAGMEIDIYRKVKKKSLCVVRPHVFTHVDGTARYGASHHLRGDCAGLPLFLAQHLGHLAIPGETWIHVGEVKQEKKSEATPFQTL